MGNRVVELASRLASRVKAADYVIDERISSGYLSRVMATRGLMTARGRLRFPLRPAAPFIGAGTTIRAAHLLTFGSGVTLGDDSYLDAMSTDGVCFGRNVSLGRGSRIECTGNLQTLGKGMVVGDNVGLGTDSFYGCAGGIEIGDDTIIGNFVSMHSENHRASDPDLPIRLQGVTHEGISIGSGCWVGAKSTILDGARIGDGCIVAAGAVVTAGTYPDRSILGGVPAKVIKSRS